MAKRYGFRVFFISFLTCSAVAHWGVAQQIKPTAGAISTPDAETPSSNPIAADLMALERKIEEDTVRGDAADAATLISSDFTMVHGDGWTTGGRPGLADDRKAFLKRVSDKEYHVHDLDNVKFEIHGDVAISYGRYVSLFEPKNRDTSMPAALNSIWFERVFAKRNGKWVYLSHRTVHGPIPSPAGIDPTSVANGAPGGGQPIDSPSSRAGGAKAAGVPEALDPTVDKSPAAAEVMAFEKKMEEAVVRGDTDYVSSLLADDFLMGHGDGWVRGGRPMVVDNKEGFLKRVASKQYFSRDLDSVKVEMHGDIAITYGRYIAQEKTSNPAGTWFSVWYERVYAKRDGKWVYLSHRTVHGPTFGPDKATVSSK